MKKGRLISFEGPDGAGKSTQIKRLEAFLEARGFPYICSREPGGTPIGEKLRELILDKRYSEMSRRTEALLYAAARAQHVDEVIRPALEEGKIVICDRFTDSSIAYQGYGRTLGEDVIRALNAFATEGLQPDLTVLLLLDPEEGMRRAEKREALDRLESEAAAFRAEVNRGYLRIAEEEPERVIYIAAGEDIEDIAAQIRKRMEVFLEE